MRQTFPWAEFNHFLMQQKHLWIWESAEITRELSASADG